MEKIRVGLYIRVSTQEQAIGGYSIGEQTERLTKYADAQDWTIFNTYTDPGFSGAKIERPGLRSLIADAGSHKLDKVVVYKLDRLSRSQKDTLYLIEDVFIKNGVDFVSMTENFDTSTPLGRAMIGILSVFAQLEREQIKERLTIGRVGRAKSGLYSGNDNTPTGYKYVDGKLEIDPYYADIVRRLFREFNEGRSLKAIAKDLNNEGVTTSKGYNWIGSNIRAILLHRIYIGEIEFRGEIYTGSHEAIIDRETFDQTQKRLEDRKQNDENYLRFSQKSSILTGLCYCTHCKAKKAILTGNPDKNGYRPRFIGCKDKKKKGCPDDRIPKEIVEDYVLNQIRKLTLDPDYFESLKRGSSGSDLRSQIQAIKNKISDNEKKIERLTDLYLIGGIDLNTIRERVEKLSGSIEADRIRLEKLKESQEEERSDETILTLASMIDSGDEESIKIAVGSLIKRIDFTGKEIAIHWNF